MKKEWFEPGPDGVSPFERQYWNCPMGMATSIAAAFRALLAEDAAQEPPALRVGDVVRLEDPAQMCCEQFIGVQATITGFREDGNPYYTSSRGDSWWPVSALTLIRRAGEAQSVDTQRSIAAALANGQLSLQDEITRLTAELHARNDEIVGLRSEVERLTNKRDEWCQRWKQLHNEVRTGFGERYSDGYTITRQLTDLCNELAAVISERDAARAEVERLEEIVKDTNNVLDVMTRDLAAERDALQARIDAGVPVCRFPSMKKSWSENLSSFPESCERGILLIDARPIDQPDAAMVDERKGEADRRESEENLQRLSRRVFQERGFKQQGATYRERQQCNDRRRVAGTRADRGNAS